MELLLKAQVTTAMKTQLPVKHIHKFKKNILERISKLQCGNLNLGRSTQLSKELPIM
jgi:tartrate dehydratase alpha subunit/fumarate hydratase class I-like protein